jgi:hypothetical protein
MHSTSEEKGMRQKSVEMSKGVDSGWPTRTIGFPSFTRLCKSLGIIAKAVSAFITEGIRSE